MNKTKRIWTTTLAIVVNVVLLYAMMHLTNSNNDGELTIYNFNESKIFLMPAIDQNNKILANTTYDIYNKQHQFLGTYPANKDTPYNSSSNYTFLANPTDWFEAVVKAESNKGFVYSDKIEIFADIPIKRITPELYLETKTPSVKYLFNVGEMARVKNNTITMRNYDYAVLELKIENIGRNKYFGCYYPFSTPNYFENIRVENLKDIHLSNWIYRPQNVQSIYKFRETDNPSPQIVKLKIETRELQNTTITCFIIDTDVFWDENRKEIVQEFYNNHWEEIGQPTQLINIQVNKK